MQGTVVVYVFLLFSALALLASAAIPSSFDGRQSYGKCLGPVKNEGQCGAVVALESVDDLASAKCIATGGSYAALSFTYIASCCADCGGCDGGDSGAIVRFLEQNGTITSSCWGTNTNCPVTRCADGTSLRFYRAKFNRMRTVEQIQTAIMQVGPVLAFVDATSFEDYQGGVMTCKGSADNLDHAVSLLGWGEQGGISYWLGVNSWGEDWGMNGYFLIERGVDACGIEILDYSIQYVDR